MSKTKPVRIAALRISNILGITEAEIKPGKVTLIEGANGLGKTSILEAFRAVLSGGHDATLLRQGAEHGEIVMVLDDGVEIEKTVTGDKTTVTVKDPELGRLSKPAAFLDRLRDAFSLNPVDFLLAKKETRLQLLLSAIPLKVSKMDLGEVLPLCSGPVNCDQHALQVLSVIERDLYDQRTGINRSMKDKKSTVAELRKTLPPEAEAGDWQEQLRKAKAAQSSFLAECDTAAREISTDIEQRRQQAREAATEAKILLESERERQLEKIRRNFADKINTGQRAVMEQLTDIESIAEAALGSLRQQRQQGEQTHAHAVAEAEAASQTFIRAQAARDHIAKMIASIDTLESDTQALTAGLDDLSTIKSDLLDRLPIKGVAIQDGEIVVDGIAFDRVNESRRIRLAVDIAMLRAGNLPFLGVDGIERLDSKSIAALEQAAMESNIQLLLTRVTDGALDVKVIA